MKTKKIARSNKYIKNKYIKKNLWEFKVKHKNRALSADRDAISFHFTTDWWRGWCKFSKPIKGQESKAERRQLFNCFALLFGNYYVRYHSRKLCVKTLRCRSSAPEPQHSHGSTLFVYVAGWMDYTVDTTWVTFSPWVIILLTLRDVT